MAFHALCGDKPALAFDLCVRAFSFALRAGLVDVAKGYVNDVEAERVLRQASRFSYFKKTIMVFRRA